MPGCWLIVCGAGVTVALFTLRLLLWPLRLLWRGLRWLVESAFNWVRGDGFHGNKHTSRDPFERFDSDFEAALRRRLGAPPPRASQGFASQSAAFPAPSPFPPPGQFPPQPGQFPPPAQFPPQPGQFPAQPSQFSSQPGQVNPNFRRPNLTPGREYQPGQFPAQPGQFPSPAQFPAQPAGQFPAPPPGQFPAQPAQFPPPGQFPAQPGQFPAPPGPSGLPPLPPLPPISPGGQASPLDVDAERERQRRRDEGDSWGGDLLSGMDGLFGGR